VRVNIAAITVHQVTKFVYTDVCL